MHTSQLSALNGASVRKLRSCLCPVGSSWTIHPLRACLLCGHQTPAKKLDKDFLKFGSLRPGNLTSFSVEICGKSKILIDNHFNHVKSVDNLGVFIQCIIFSFQITHSTRSLLNGKSGWIHCAGVDLHLSWLNSCRPT